MKPFFYKIIAADFLSKVATTPENERASFLLKMAVDLVAGESDDVFISSLISEAHKYHDLKRMAGSAGGRAKAEKWKSSAV